MKGFKNVRAYIYGKGIITTNIGVKDGKIVYIGSDAGKITEEYSRYEGAVVLPGFIDEHIHGAFGADAMDGEMQALHIIATSIAEEGTTSFLATTMTQKKENIKKALGAVKEYKATNNASGAELLGVHLEGPFISQSHVGAQPIEYVTLPDVELFKEYNECSGKSIKMVSLAPETDGAMQLINYLNENGIVASAGHTDATYCDVEKAMAQGLTCVTHTFNAQKPLHHREIGTVGSAMLFDGLYTEAICDGIHLSIPAIKLLIKNKPHDKFILITDSMRAKNLPDGISELGGQEVIVKDGQARLKSGALAGSVLKMNVAIKNLVLLCGVKFTDAVDFATINPATNLGVIDRIGTIACGKDANFTVMDGEFNILQTIRGGNVIFRK